MLERDEFAENECEDDDECDDDDDCVEEDDHSDELEEVVRIVGAEVDVMS